MVKDEFMPMPDDLMEVVAADLRHLKSDWNESVDDDSLRRGSTVLRRLLVQGDLQRAWRGAGFADEPMINCSNLQAILKSESSERIRFASAGGARYGGVELRGALMVNCVKTPDQIKAEHDSGVPSEIVGLKKFVESPCIVVKGQIVVRRVLVKYVANKLGGAHHDRKRGTSHEESLYALLDEARVEVHLLGKPAIYFELLAIGQALAGAEDIVRLEQRAAER